MKSVTFKHMTPSQVEMTVVIDGDLASGDHLMCISILIIVNKVQCVNCLF